jgi:prepilin-type N-terminal cleavage/methylation domain-containing protein
MTLTELLIVIAIIGILASIVIGNFSQAKVASREKAARSLAAVAQNTAYSCIIRNTEITTPQSGTPICTLTPEQWPQLPPGWAYGASASTYNTRAFSFAITNGAITITCTETGCI